MHTALAFWQPVRLDPAVVTSNASVTICDSMVAPEPSARPARQAVPGSVLAVRTVGFTALATSAGVSATTHTQLGAGRIGAAVQYPFSFQYVWIRQR